MAAAGVQSEPSSLIDRDSLLEVSLRKWKNEFEQGIRGAADRGDLEAFFTIPQTNGWRQIVKLLIRMAKENRLSFIRAVCSDVARPRAFRCYPFDWTGVIICDEITFDDFKLHESDKTIRIGVTWGY